MTAPPSTARDVYVIGRLGSYLAPTVDAIDRHLARLAARLVTEPRFAARLRTDMDLLLDRRADLMQAAR